MRADQVTVSIEVLVFEDDEEVAVMYVRYYAGQPYTVKIDTPDVDRKVHLKVGAANRSEWDEFCDDDRIVTGE